MKVYIWDSQYNSKKCHKCKTNDLEAYQIVGTNSMALICNKKVEASPSRSVSVYDLPNKPRRPTIRKCNKFDPEECKCKSCLAWRMYIAGVSYYNIWKISASAVKCAHIEFKLGTGHDGNRILESMKR